jgi:hypothetical protein
MSFKNKYINITDWAGNNLLNAPYDSKEVDRVLDMNRCSCESGVTYELKEFPSGSECKICDGTGYSGDFEITWEDESDKDDCNVYEYINY